MSTSLVCILHTPRARCEAQYSSAMLFLDELMSIILQMAAVPVKGLKGTMAQAYHVSCTQGR